MTAGKVVLLCGSPRLEGNTAQVLRECATVLEREGIETETILLAEKHILSCTACGLCTGGECALDDGLNEIIDKIREAGGFIVGTPVYFGTARGDVMSALQRIGMVSMSSDSFLSRKVGGPIAVARRGGHTATLQEMLMFFLINDMIVPGSTYWNMVFGRTPGEALGDEEGMKTVRRFAENVAFLIKKLA
ncbi:MAG TPA: flavodoxin family protein [Methanoculleus sp.]|nr:flavodoxin family protein [Methanoculleus sp.]